jgi:hypothetical protein
MTLHPTVDESFARLHSAGWSIGDTTVLGPDGLEWLVSGTRGTHSIEARGKTEAEAWARACQLAEGLGLAGEASP